MALFSLMIRCEGLDGLVTQASGGSPYEAVQAFLKAGILRQVTAKTTDWPDDFSLRDVYAFYPLDGLPNAYFCGLGAKGKYVEINLFQTSQRSSPAQRYCGPRRRQVTLR